MLSLRHFQFYAVLDQKIQHAPQGGGAPAAGYRIENDQH
jgi:hypothetical protein